MNARLFAALLALGLTVSAAGRYEPPVRLHEAVLVSFHQQYDSAWKLIAPRRDADTLDPAPLYWQAALVQMLCHETGSLRMVDSFHRLNDRAEVLCRRRLTRDEDDAVAYFYLGMVRLNRANSHSWEQRRTQALTALLSAAPPLRTALALDSTLDDACHGLGMVEYFRAQADNRLLGLGLLGSRPAAYRLVDRAAAGGGLCAPTARFSRAWMLGQDRRFDEALEQCRGLLAEFPGNRLLLRTMRDILYSKGDDDGVLATGRELEENIGRACPDNRYYLSENRLVMAKAWNRLGQADSCLSYCDKVLAWKHYQDEVPWLHNYVLEAQALKAGLGS